MTLMIVGLVLFLGLHSVRIFADDWRNAKRAAIGENAWKGLYSLVSLVGFVAIVWGYSIARQSPVQLWMPPIWTRHLAALLTLVSFVLIAAAYVPRNHLKAATGHPMVAGTKVWAFSHLLANGTLADLILFGSFLIWTVLLFRSARARDRAAQIKPAAGEIPMTALTLVAGAIGWAAFAFWLHLMLIGVRPFG